MVYSRYDMSSGPGVAYQWDMNVCHKWYFVQHSAGNVPYKGQLPSDMWMESIRLPSKRCDGLLLLGR